MSDEKDSAGSTEWADDLGLSEAGTALIDQLVKIGSLFNYSAPAPQLYNDPFVMAALLKMQYGNSPRTQQHTAKFKDIASHFDPKAHSDQELVAGARAILERECDEWTPITRRFDLFGVALNAFQLRALASGPKRKANYKRFNYVLIPGPVTPENCDYSVYVDAKTLAKKYGVSYSKCRVLDREQPGLLKDFEDTPNTIYLTPRSDDNYVLPCLDTD